jgi:hypothetical protein
MEMDNDDDDTATLNKPPSPSKCPIPERQQELYRLQSQSIKNSFQETKPRGSSKHTQYIFEDLSLIQRNIQDNFGTRKRNLSSHYSDRHTSDDRKDSVANDTISSLASSPSRPPLKPIDTNSCTDGMQPIWNRGRNQ